MTSEQGKALAEALRVDEQYLYQCLSGRKDMKPAEAVRIERESEQRLRRWQLRQSDWHLIWPDLIGTEGAPAVPMAKEEASDAA